MGVTASPKRGFGADVVLLAGARLATVAAFFGVSVAGARLLSPEMLGSATVGQTLGMIAALVANGGVNIATIYVLRQEPGRAITLVPRLVALAVGSAGLAMLLVVAASPFVLGGLVDAWAWPLMAVSALLAAAMIGFEFAGALLLGTGRTGWFTAVELARGGGALIAVTILLLGPWRSDAGFVVGLALGYAFAALLGLTRTRRDRLSLVPRYDREVAGRALAFGVRGQVGNVFAFLGARLDLLLVPALLDLRAAGIYVIAVRSSDVIGQVATAAASFVFPRVADRTAGAATLLTERATRATLIVVAASALALGLAAEPVLRIAFGAVYAEGTTALLILLVAALPLALGRILAADLKGRGRPGLVSWSSLLMVVATVVLDLALIPVLGIEGAALASLIAYAAGAVALMMAFRSVGGGRLTALVPRPADVRDMAALATRTLSRGNPT